MPKFRYTAVDTRGKPVHGVLDATSEAAVADRVHGQGCMLVRAAEVGKGGGISALLHADVALERGLSKAVLAHFARELSVMLTAGQDIDHALQFLVEISENRRSRKIFETVRNQVRGGKSLSASLAEQPRNFSRLFVTIIRAGEASGKLAESLAHLADLLERESRLAANVQSALIYPILLVAAATSTVVFLLTSVLPQFTPIFQQAGASLPGPTRFLMAAGDLVRNDGGLILAAMLCLAAIGYMLLREPGPRAAFDRFVLVLPVAGTLIRRAEAGRLTRTLGTLLANGVSLITALGIARGVLSNVVAVKVVDQATAQVKAGARLANALVASYFFPPQTIHLLRLGEEAGKLGEMALRAASIHDEQVGQSVQRLVSLMVPVITIVMGAIVAGIVGSLLVAMMSLNDLAL